MSRIAIKTKKERGNEEALSQELFFQSGLLKRHSAGIYSMGNLIVKARNNVIKIIRDVMEKNDCVELSLPTLQPKQLWVDSGRWDTYTSSNEMFHFEGRNGEYCLGPTAEEVVMDYMKDALISYKDLPVNVYQIGPKYRDEIRVRGGLLRSKEFIMKDGYSFHATHEDMVDEYGKMKNAYSEIFSRLGLDAIPVQSLNAEMGGKVSEEFMHISEIGEDKLLYDKENGIALNVQILDHPEKINELKKQFPNFTPETLERKPCIEIAHVFQLGQRYSKQMNGYFMDKNSKMQPYHMGCYGFGVNRALSAICQQHLDEEGLVWPKNIAPYNSTIIYTEEHQEMAKDIYQSLQESGLPTILDDRNNGIGFKIKDSKLLGIPYMIIIGKNANGGYVEVESRATKEKFKIHQSEVANFLRKYNS